MKSVTLSILLAGSMLAASCGGEKAETSTAAAQPTTQAATLPANLFQTAAPSNATPLHQARQAMRAGETVSFTGYIGGRENPFTDDRAVFLVADMEKAPPCTDGCPVAWDACCTPGELITANSATVRVVDGNGQIMRIGLNGQNGLRPGAEVAITGTVHEIGDMILVVDATAIAVK